MKKILSAILGAAILANSLIGADTALAENLDPSETYISEEKIKDREKDAIGIKNDFNDEINIVDTSLKQCVRNALNLGDEDPILQKDASRLESLSCSFSDIAHLDGLENFHALRDINLMNNAISIIDPIADLVNLRVLLLNFNKIVDIEPISGLSNLTKLGLSNNRIDDLSALSDKDNIWNLDVSSNKIKNISPLAGLNINRNIIRASNQEVDLLDIVVGELQVNEFIDIDGTQASIAVVSGNITIVGDGDGWIIDRPGNIVLDFSTNSEVNFNGSITQKGISRGEVDISDSFLRECIATLLGVSPEDTITVEQALQLQSLRCDHAGIEELQGLEYFTNLEVMNLNNNHISDISAIASLVRLVHLTMTQNMVTDTAPLSELFGRLRSVNLMDNNIIDIEPIDKLTELRTLNLSGNKLSDVSGLSSVVSSVHPYYLLLDRQNISLPNIGVGEFQINVLKDIDSSSPLVDVKFGDVTLDKDNLGWFANSSGDIVLTFNSSKTSFSGTVNQSVDVNPTVYISDENLRKCITDSLGISEGDVITVDRAISLRTLICEYKSIESLSGIQSFINLNMLILSKNNIVDIAPLKNMAYLEMLFLDHNSIEDISPFKELRNITVLDISDNKIQDLRSLPSSIRSLTATNQVIELKNIPVGQLQLSPLYYIDDSRPVLSVESGNAVIGENSSDWTINNPGEVSLSFINENNLFSGSITQTAFSDGEVEVIDIPDSNLRSCIADSLQIDRDTNITVEMIPDLRYLFCSNFNTIISLEGLQYFTALEVLWAGSNQIVDVTPLSGLENLSSLDLSRNQITSIDSLKTLPSLLDLNLNYNLISSIQNSFNSLIRLDITGNRIVDLSFLRESANLAALYANDNQIFDISPLENLLQLKELDLHGNEIFNINSLSNMRNLGLVSLGSNQIVDVSPLLESRNIFWLDLSDNRIFDLTHIGSIDNQSLRVNASNQRVILDSIPIGFSQGNPLLDIRGRTPSVTILSGDGIVFDGSVGWLGFSIGELLLSFNSPTTHGFNFSGTISQRIF